MIYRKQEDYVFASDEYDAFLKFCEQLNGLCIDYKTSITTSSMTVTTMSGWAYFNRKGGDSNADSNN